MASAPASDCSRALPLGIVEGPGQKDERILTDFMRDVSAVLVLSPVVVRAARHYFRRLDSGEMPRVERR